MNVELERRYAEAETAARVAGALFADNPAHVTVTVDGPRLTIQVVAPSAASARATLEDLLACVQVAERSVRAGRSH
ncbi:MAG: KEOPS complex subunit Pcc1 [Thermoplasmata archaeon]